MIYIEQLRYLPGDIWWARIFDRLDEFLHNYPKLPKSSVTESNLPLHIGTKVTIKNYNTFLRNYGSSGYKFQFQINSDNCTGEVYIIGMASTVHEDVVLRLQRCFDVPNNGVIDDPLIVVSGQALHNDPNGIGVELAPDATVRPNLAIVQKPATSTRIPPPPGDVDGNPCARIMCEVAIGQNVGQLGQKCFTWMVEPYIRAVISIKILDPRPGVREPGTGYFFRSMTAKLYRQGMVIQRWDFGNVRKYSNDPLGDFNNPAVVLCNTPNDPRFQISVPISEVFWDPPSPIPPNYVPYYALKERLLGIWYPMDFFENI
ncbi:hypothetical protein GLOIN_2v1734790 [Rhizophagus clarus]|uniref:Uncharacterized protein n=1 Tax=Rhizophagus clarus TaxID=94130 RepID=A0A8H3QW20_9GLOM|nr:hypothetical protein GLOIN_2v1734790 [Rhizophagus clarus]